MKCGFVFVLYFAFLEASPILPNSKYKNKQCGYQACPEVKPNVLNVHVVPHSHDDVGWLKTVDQYYYGARNNIQRAGVQYILDSVIDALLQNPERRFIYVETAFFWKWWEDRDADLREKAKLLVNNGQLEIAGGAWSMNDEAASHYQSIIDQFTWGFRKLEETLGQCARPKVGWQIDPFGHSREMASLFSQFGFDGLFFARLDWRDKSTRLKSKTAEMLWQGSDNLGNSSQLFTSVLYNHYSAPPGFCFDTLCSDTPIVDDKRSPEYNAENRAKDFLKFVQTQSQYYRTNNVIVTMGDDFNYQDAGMYFTNLDKLISAVNALQTNVSVFYSSPSCYLKAVNEADLSWSLKTDDFFPYASDPHAYWTGFYTSRPTSKRFERLGNNFLQVSKQLAALSGAKDSFPGLDPLREAMGVMQHHDAITGTEKQHVADDYARMLTDGFQSSEAVAQEALKNLTQQEQGIELSTFQSCLLLNISKCDLSESNDEFLVTVYNPLSRLVSHYVRLPVSKQGYEVSDLNGTRLEVQHVPIFEMIAKIPGRDSKAEMELIFKAESLPPLGYKIYLVKHNPANQSPLVNQYAQTKTNVTFDALGLLESVHVNGKDIPLRQNFLYYKGASGNNAVFENRSSGAYIFRPKTQDAVTVAENVTIVEYDGPLVKEFHQTFNNWVGQVVRIYPDKESVELTWIVGPIPVDDKIGKEIISRFSTNLDTKGVFYTDSNGRETLERVRDFRPTFNLTTEEPVSENYYPITSKIVIKDKKQNIEVAILNDRAQGGSSIHDGEIELMVHRRLLHDDAFGVGEALNEVAFGEGLVATGKHYILIGSSGETEDVTIAAKTRLLAQELSLSSWLFLSPIDKSFNQTNNNQYSGLKEALPKNVQILTLEPWDKNTILLRLEHILEKNEDPKLSLPVQVNIQELFSNLHVTNITEVSLDANLLASEISRLPWKTEDTDKSNNYSSNEQKQIYSKEVTLFPMQIKTFIVNIEAKTK